jgi:hypothetical protein
MGKSFGMLLRRYRVRLSLTRQALAEPLTRFCTGCRRSAGTQVVARRGRGPGRTDRPGLSLARPGHVLRRCESGPNGRSGSAALPDTT